MNEEDGIGESDNDFFSLEFALEKVKDEQALMGLATNTSLIWVRIEFFK